jgi:hypothetical protein
MCITSCHWGTANEQYVFAVSFLNTPLEYSVYSLLVGSGIPICGM